MPELPRVWATEGKYLRKSLILAFIEGIGHELSAEDTESILQHSLKDVTADEVEAIRKACRASTWQKAMMRALSTKLYYYY
jgi:hypothetical protein